MAITSPNRDKNMKLVYELGSFGNDLTGIDTPHNDVLVLIININTFDVKRVLIDQGSSSEIMYLNLYN